jgi:transcription initiation factor IIE alpha subunit
MKNIKLLIVLILFLCLSSRSVAQLNPIKQYSEDPIQFLEEIKSMFEVTNMSKKEIKDFMEQFTLAWNSPKCNEKLKKATYNSCNMMIKKKLRILPEYKSYLTSIMNFVNSNQSEDNFIAWQECVTKILNGKIIKYYSDYLDMSERLFATNTFYGTSVVEYSSSNSNYKFEYDSVPVVIFPSMNLRCFNNQNDSGIVYNTKGTYYPYTGIFNGQGGKVNWKRAGFDENTVWGELKNYQVVLKTSGFTADSVTFYNSNYFQKPLLGRLTEKVVSEKGVNISYPRFDSYSKRMKIIDIAKDIDYDGGFSMRGPKFLGAGSKEEDAKLIFKREGKMFLEVASKSIGITKEKLSAENSKIKFYFDKDSITHPSVNMKFMTETRILSLVRDNNGISKSPFVNTFHKVDMFFEELSWKIDDPKIDLRMLVGNSQEDAMFESTTYFRPDRYDQLQGLDMANPLAQLRDYIKKNNNSRDFYGDEYARYLKLSPNEVRPNLITLASKGLILYDAEDDEIHINDKLFDYIAYRSAKLDYDVIQFPSVVRGVSNASINLLNYDMTIFGVRQIFMSDSQSVTIYPAEQKIILKKNRDFVFAGIVHAGRFDFFGKEFSFDYNKFIVDLKNVDSLRLTVQSQEPDAYGEFPLVKVKTVIEHINGNLEIDEPGNKSGLKKASKYPIFNSFKDSYAYYNKKQIQNGRYPKEKFYFHLDPFTIDSLDNFSNEGLNFQGEMVTADIFPVFREALRLQPDYSLGFVTQAPAAGYPVYGGKGTYNSTIKLSNQGLRGAGQLKYVTSITKSDDFTFFPDSTNTIAQTFDVTEQKTPPEFPQVHGESSKIHWVPGKDVMKIWNDKDKKIATYSNRALFSGELSLTPKELTANGKMEFNSAIMESKLMNFKSVSFNSDTANFALKDVATGELAFTTLNVKANVDFNKRLGEFKSNGEGSIVQFPANQYICFMESFKWFMDDSAIEIGGSEKQAAETKDGLDLEGPEFISVHPKQDSLRFHASSGKYDLKKLVISAKGVTYINIADARVYPDQGDVIIDKNASMRPLTNSKIVANSVTKYHNLYNCTVNPTSRKNYTGSGYYDYIDETKAKKTFYFSDIGVDTTYQTFAETEIQDTSHFTLSPNFEYKGKVKLRAAKTFLVFDGSARIRHDCSIMPRTWFRFESEIDPNSIYIPIAKEPVDESGRPIAASFMVTTDSTHFYSAFLASKKSTNDSFVLPADGVLFFDKGAREYRISNKEKLVERSLPGNYLSLNTAECKMYGEGKIDLGGDFGQLKIQSVGNMTHALIPDSTLFDMLMSIDFFFSDDAIDKMSEAINTDSHLKPTDVARPVFEKGLREIVGKEQADKLISQLNLYGSYKKFPDELKKTIFINDLKMKWNKETRSYTSIGQIGIGNINKNQINKFVDGSIELIRKRGGDVLTIYLELDPTNWYYFNYTRGTMLAVSSSETFNTVLKELKQDKRKKDGAKGEQDFYYNICPPAKKTAYLRKTLKTTEE